MPKHKTKGPITLQGAAVPKQAFRSDASLSLDVIHRDSAATGRGLSALVHPSSLQQLWEQSTSTSTSASASASASATSTAGGPDGPSQHPSSLFLQLASGSDCVLHTRSSEDVPPGCIEVDEVQQANLRLCAGETYSFSIFVPSNQHSSAPAEMEAPETEVEQSASVAVGESSSDEESEDAAGPAEFPFELTDLDVEVRLLHTHGNVSSSSPSASVQVDASMLAKAFCKQCFGRVLAVNEYVVIDMTGLPPLLLRVTSTNTLTAEEQQDVLGYHCFRGLLTPDTRVYFTSATAAVQQSVQATSAVSGAVAQQLAALSTQQQPSDGHQSKTYNQQEQQQQQHRQHTGVDNEEAGTDHSSGSIPSRPVQSRVAAGAAGVELLNACHRPPGAAPTNVVHVFTSDGEWFPVKKRLLRPCIALTKVVRDSGETAPEVTVDIDTLTFDRVIIFLEAYALKRAPPRFAIHLLSDLKEAGRQLGLRSLQGYCEQLLGSKQAALQVYSFAEVQRANADGKVWLILDGMVLDVGRWLPEHPGGATIIPKQSLDCDCARFFEMYHASKESFLYLEEFYIGELLPSDRQQVPLGGKQPPSQDFLMQLRDYTCWRQQMQQRALELDSKGCSFTSF